MQASLSIVLLIFCPLTRSAETNLAQVSWNGKTYDLHPATHQTRPDLPSPCRTVNGIEVVTARTEQRDYAIVPVTITPGVMIRPWEAPLEIDREDFPTLAATGRHSEAELERTRTITGRSVREITELGRPGRLSSSGFLAEDEDILSVLTGDNRLATRLGLTHAELARPLLHVCDLMRGLHRESGRGRTNELFYGGKRLTLAVGFTRGGQKSIFNDGLDGAWTIRIQRDLEAGELVFLERAYAHLDPPPARHPGQAPHRNADR